MTQPEEIVEIEQGSLVRHGDRVFRISEVTLKWLADERSVRLEVSGMKVSEHLVTVYRRGQQDQEFTKYDRD